MSQKTTRALTLFVALLFTAAALWGCAVLPSALFAASDNALLSGTNPRPLPETALSAEMAEIPLVKTLYDYANLYSNDAYSLSAGHFDPDQVRDMVLALVDNFETQKVFSAEYCALLREAANGINEDVPVSDSLNSLGIYTLQVYDTESWPFLLNLTFLEDDSSLVYLSFAPVGSIPINIDFNIERYFAFAGLGDITDWQKHTIADAIIEYFSPSAQLCCVYSSQKLWGSFSLQFYSRPPQN